VQCFQCLSSGRFERFTKAKVPGKRVRRFGASCASFPVVDGCRGRRQFPLWKIRAEGRGPSARFVDRGIDLESKGARSYSREGVGPSSRSGPRRGNKADTLIAGYAPCVACRMSVPTPEERGAENHRRHRDRRMRCFPLRDPSVLSVSPVVALVFRGGRPGCGLEPAHLHRHGPVDRGSIAQLSKLVGPPTIGAALERFCAGMQEPGFDNQRLEVSLHRARFCA
jgi:hypothetical protein